MIAGWYTNRQWRLLYINYLVVYINNKFNFQNRETQEIWVLDSVNKLKIYRYNLYTKRKIEWNRLYIVE